jgi:hypothetical protein
MKLKMGKNPKKKIRQRAANELIYLNEKKKKKADYYLEIIIYKKKKMTY